MIITTQKDAVTVPSIAVQRGPDGLYVWVVKQDNTVEQRPIKAQMVGEDLAIATDGLKTGERVVLTGQSRLDVGTHVDIRSPNATPNTAGQPAGKS
jgi:multidrug efflux system membrane fusion protein